VFKRTQHPGGPAALVAPVQNVALFFLSAGPAALVAPVQNVALFFLSAQMRSSGRCCEAFP